MTTRNRVIIVASALVLGAVALAIATRSSEKAPETAALADRAVPVDTARAVKKNVPVIVEGLGSVTSLATVTVRSRVDGLLDRVPFREGAAVKKGELLALVDPRPFEIQLAQGQAAFSRDTANVINARLNLDRYVKLRAGNLIPQQQVDDQRSMVAQLDAAVMADRAQIDTARLNLEYARITSPITGIVGVRLVDRGNIVHAADTTGIVIVTQIDPIAVLFSLPQDLLPRVQRAMSKGAPLVEAFARSGEDRLAEGQLESLDNQVNAATATIRLKATMPNPTHRLWPNQFVKARLHVDTLDDALVIPTSAIQRGPQGAFAYVVAPDRTVSMRVIEVGSVEGEEAIVTKGIAPGDVVVTDGQNLLRPGAKVAPRAESETTTTSAPIPSR